MKDLAALVKDPALSRRFSDSQWNLILTQARQANVVARLKGILEVSGNLLNAPDVVRETFTGSAQLVAHLQVRVRHELSELGSIADSTPYPVVVLKGAAYIISHSKAGLGRGTSDIDVLVHESNIDDLESRLLGCGWHFDEALTDYDDHYYRQLAHELPPLRHPNFQFELDVHHNLLQPTHRLTPKIDQFLARVTPVDSLPFCVLDKTDQLIHSATHLLMGDEMRGGIRDLMDISFLVDELRSREVSLVAIAARAEEVGLARPVDDALRAVYRHLKVQDEGWREYEAHRRGRLRIGERLLDRLIDEEVFLTHHNQHPIHRISGALVLLRAKLLQMPLLTLLKHSLLKYVFRSGR